MLRAAALSAAVAAIALGILAVLPGHGSSVVGPAAAALEVSDRHDPAHGDARRASATPDGSVVSWQSESWRARTKPRLLGGRSRMRIGRSPLRNRSVRGDTQELFERGGEHHLHRLLRRRSPHLIRCRSRKIVSRGCRLRGLTPGSPRDLDAALQYSGDEESPSLRRHCDEGGRRAPSRAACARRRIQVAATRRSRIHSGPRFSRSSIPGAAQVTGRVEVERVATQSASSLPTGGPCLTWSTP